VALAEPITYPFTPNDNFNGCDGFFNGELMQPGVYVYLANFRDKVGTSFQVSGNVTLVR
jgi:hypothetical protein